MNVIPLGHGLARRRKRPRAARRAAQHAHRAVLRRVHPRSCATVVCLHPVVAEPAPQPGDEICWGIVLCVTVVGIGLALATL
jgi:hypothetical protein